MGASGPWFSWGRRVGFADLEEEEEDKEEEEERDGLGVMERRSRFLVGNNRKQRWGEWAGMQGLKGPSAYGVEL